MKLLKKFIMYIKGLFSNKIESHCRLDLAYNTAENSLRRYKSTRDAAVSTMAKRHMLNVKKNINRMRYTTDPEVFNLLSESVLLLCSRIQGMDSAHKSLIDGAYKISELFTKEYETPNFDGDAFVYYGVIFERRGKEYYYLSDDMPCEEGQYVLVPTGENMENKVVRIDGVYRFTPTNAPYPKDKLKSIIKVLV